jgi:hypothetical protein
MANMLPLVTVLMLIAGLALLIAAGFSPIYKTVAPSNRLVPFPAMPGIAFGPDSATPAPTPAPAPVPAPAVTPQGKTLFGKKHVPHHHHKTIKWLLISGLIVIGLATFVSLSASETVLQSPLCMGSSTFMWIGAGLLLAGVILFWTEWMKAQKKNKTLKAGSAQALSLTGVILLLGAVILATMKVDATCYWNKQIELAFGSMVKGM